MLKGSQLFEDLQKSVQDIIAKSPVADIEKNIKAVMAQGFAKMDLVTREEFEEQMLVIQRLRERIEVLEARLKEKE